MIRSSASRERCVADQRRARTASRRRSRGRRRRRCEFGESAAKPSAPLEQHARDRDTRSRRPRRSLAAGRPPSARGARAARGRARAARSARAASARPTPGCARCRCVYDGMSAVSSAARLLEHHAAAGRARRRRAAGTRPSSRAAWPWPPGRCGCGPCAACDATSPTSSCRRRSISVCTSSSDAMRLLARRRAAPRRRRARARCALLSSSVSTPGAPERHGPRLREADVERPEPEVDADRVVERVERRGGAAAEAPAPELVRRVAAWRRGGASHVDVVIATSRRRSTRQLDAPASAARRRRALPRAAASSWSLSARTRAGSANRRMKPAASLCWYTSSSPNVTKRSSYSACTLSRPTTMTRALVQAQRDRAGDALLRDVHERVVRLALRRPPAALVHEVRVARRDEVLGRERAAVEHELLELASARRRAACRPASRRRRATSCRPGGPRRGRCGRRRGARRSR